MTDTQHVSEITRSYREALGATAGRPISQEQFGGLLTEGLLNSGLTKATIWNWEKRKGEPDWDFLLSLYTYHYFSQDRWQFRFAVDCLRAMKPETFDSGVIELAQPRIAQA